MRFHSERWSIRLTTVIRTLGWILGAGIVFTAVLILLGHLAEAPFDRPDPKDRYSREELERVEKNRQCRSSSRIVFWQDVDYSKPDARWRPKNEAPILHTLVKEGKLPPVNKRVPSEPLVLKGIDGVGRYGGSWLRLAINQGDVYTISNRLSGATLLRFSPHGEPVVPHVAKSVVASLNNREFTITLRKGMKWSDGYPFTTEDVAFWVRDIAMNKTLNPTVPELLMHRGKVAEFEVRSPTVFVLRFKDPHPSFKYLLCRYAGSFIISYPKHYLIRFHPDLGDQEFIRREMERRHMISKVALFNFMADPGGYNNPECPRLWPWVPAEVAGHDEKVYVRNPFYFAVDVEGNQLPYIDRIVFQIKSREMLNLSAASGDVSMQGRHLQQKYYSTIMSRRHDFGYDVVHFRQPGTIALAFNLQRRIVPGKPSTRIKAELLRDHRFRQAVALAINRRQIISTVMDDLVSVHGGGPTAESPYYHKAMATAFTQ